MDLENKKNDNIYSKVQMSIKTLDIIISVLIAALVLTVVIALL